MMCERCITANAVLPGLTNTVAIAPQSTSKKTGHLGTAGNQTAWRNPRSDWGGSVLNKR